MTLPPLEARALMCYVSGLTREQWIARDHQLSPEQQQAYTALAQRRLLGEPLAYLMGQREFFGRTFLVGPAVLIPRPETEMLVDFVIQYADVGARVLDLGTGSGAIAVSIAAERHDLSVTAVDVSVEALEFARRNNAALSDGRVDCQVSHWFNALGEQRFDWVVSNPPYIAAEDEHLSQGDLRYEPFCALTDGADGLACLRSIIQEAPTHLTLGGRLVVEHGYDQAAAVRDLMRTAGLSEVRTQRDLAGQERMTWGQR